MYPSSLFLQLPVTDIHESVGVLKDLRQFKNLSFVIFQKERYTNIESKITVQKGFVTDNETKLHISSEL